MSVTQMEFKTEMKQLMDIIIHSLYTHKEIFLRELISNACDAIDKARFESITRQEILEGNSDWKIKVIPNKSNGTLTISDNGIGMSKESITDQLGTIARSGTKAFLEELKKAETKDRPELIGQFGVGFYSSFMVADKVTVISRPGGNTKSAVQWESDGTGTFTIEDVEKETRGSDIILHLKEEEKEFLNEWTIRSTIKKFSDFIEHPVVMDIEKEEEGKETQIQEQTINSQKALWLKAKSEISQDDYNQFYNLIAHDQEPPLEVIHYVAEGTLEFRALLFIPQKRPLFFMEQSDKYGPHLYIRRISIKDNCSELLPPYLKFVKGVVDSSDLPLNVSREMLQNNPVLTKIKSNLVSRVLNSLSGMMEKNIESYTGFHNEFSQVLKTGIHLDFANKDKIADLLLFESTDTKPGEFVSLKQYVENMPKDQTEIYYLIGENREVLEHSPYLEVFRSRKHAVLLMTDHVDEWVVQGLMEYNKKNLKAVDKGEVKKDTEDEQKEKSSKEKFSSLLDMFGTILPEVKNVRISNRLTESAACLVVDENEMGAHMEKLMKQLGRDTGTQTKKILEINPEHPSVEAVRALYEKDPKDSRINDYARLFYDQAVIAEGSQIKDAVAFAKRINTLLANDASR